MFLIHTASEHAELLARSVVATCRAQGWANPVQPQLLHTLFNSLLGQDLDFETLAPIDLQDAKRALVSAEERTELIQLMCAIEVLANPIAPGVEAAVERWAEELGVRERTLVFLRDVACGELEKASADFYRLNWIGDLDRKNEAFPALLARRGDSAYAVTVEADPVEAARWAALGDLPAGSVGRLLHAFYRQRGFTYPGQVGAASPALAQHDWIHLLADYGTTPMGEIEVVAFQSTCSNSPGALLGLVGALALFESEVWQGSQIVAAQHYEALTTPHGLDRLAEAIQRGRACNTNLLDFDFFAVAGESITALRKRLNIIPRSVLVMETDPLGAQYAASAPDSMIGPGS